MINLRAKSINKTIGVWNFDDATLTDFAWRQKAAAAAAAVVDEGKIDLVEREEFARDAEAL